jgi:hypothetical protein
MFYSDGPALHLGRHTAPETMRGRVAAPLLTCVRMPEAIASAVSLSQLSRDRHGAAARCHVGAARRASVAPGRPGDVLDLVQLSPAVACTSGGLGGWRRMALGHA